MNVTSTAPARPKAGNLEYRGVRYLYPFSMAFSPVADAVKYSLILADRDGARFELESESTEVSLDGIWDKLAVGFIRYSAKAHLRDGSVSRMVTTSSFYKGTPFHREQTVEPKFPLKRAIDIHYDFLVGAEGKEAYDPALPSFVWHCVIEAESRLLLPKAYPATNTPFYIWALLGYGEGNEQKASDALNVARIAADQCMTFITPEHFSWPRFPYSTISGGRMGGDQEEGNVVQPLKGALLGMGLLDLGAATGEHKYTEYARHIGEVLAAKQMASGALPFRINAETDEVVEGESSFLVSALELWDKLMPIYPGKFEEAHAKALAWLMNGPVKDFRWIGNCEDLGYITENFNHIDAKRMAIYLLDHAAGHPEYVDMAMSIDRWVEEAFVFYKPEFPLASMNFVCPAATEQSVYFYPIDAHLAEYAHLQVKLFEVTGERKYYDKAVAAAYALTHYISDELEPFTYAPDPETGYGYSDRIWFGCAADTMLALMKVDGMMKQSG